MEYFIMIVTIVNGICAIMNAVLMVKNPVKKQMADIEAQKEGQRCVMRSLMLQTYYHCLPDQEIRQFEMENYLKLYLAYKAMGGNSFIDEITADVKGFRVVH